MKTRIIYTYLIVVWISTSLIAQPAGYTQIFNDDFNSINLDTAGDGSSTWAPWWVNWNAYFLSGNGDQAFKAHYNYVGGGDNPLYMNLHDASNGSLKLYGWPTPADKKDNTYGMNYVAGMISSEKSVAFQYGYVECRAKFNTSTGHHWAMWLIPEDGSWPPEIDMVEVVGQNLDVVHMNAHSGTAQNKTDDLSWVTGVDTWNYHTYGFEWTPTTLKWHLDGNVVKEKPNYIFQPMHFVLSPEIGGNWPGPVDGSTQWPMKAEVDYLRIYEYTGNNGNCNNANITIRAAATQWGAAGGIIQLKIDNTAVANFNLSHNMQNFTHTISNFNSGNVKVHFLDDAGDAQIDYLQVNGITHQAENQSTNTGVWQGNCGGSYSEYIHCQGYIDFGNLSTTNNCGGNENNGCNANVLVRASSGWGATTGGILQLKLNNNTLASWSLSPSMINYTTTIPNFTSANLKLYFADNVGDAKVDYLKVNGTTYQAENQMTNTSVWNNNTSSCGNTYSEDMHCSGYIDFGTINCSGGGNYRIDNRDLNTASKEIIKDVPFTNNLKFNVFPNPLSDNATITYYLNETSIVNIAIHNATGKTVATLTKNQAQQAGQHQLKLDAGNLATGMYYLKLQSEDNHIIKKLMIAK